ncbi:hypothetical protein MBLNU457_g0240t1 [Dothideomycetes sp. NU457]
MYCQKCRTPLRLDDSLEHLNPASFKILIDSAPDLKPQSPRPPRTTAAKQRRDHYDELEQHAGQPQHKRAIPLPNKSPSKLNPAMSFIMLSESTIGHPTDETKQTDTENKPSWKDAAIKSITGEEPLSQQMERSMRLFEVLSARSDIDHPICSECTDLLMTGLQQRQATVNRERDAYIDFLKKAQENIPTEEEQRQTKEALAAAKEREANALNELEALEAEKAAVEREIAELDREAAELEADEEAFWRERNAFESSLMKYRDERDSLHNEFVNDNRLLESLQRTNVYNDSFCIGHDGHFGTINGLRLGKLPDHHVEWPEINAAWGQALLLLTVVADKLGYTFQGYRLLPIGSTSKIEKLDYPQGSAQSAQNKNIKPKVTSLDLYCTNDLPLGLGFLHRAFDNAMVCFLECLRQLGNHVERSSADANNRAMLPGLKMPYLINKDQIGDSSIKLGAFNQEEVWTKACKYTLTCCKFLLAHASQIDDVAEHSKPRR